MSNITINPKVLEDEAKSFTSNYYAEIKTIKNRSGDYLNLLASDWKGVSVEKWANLAYDAIESIDFVGNAIQTVGSNIAQAAQHAAKRDEDASDGTRSWGVSGVVENYLTKVTEKPELDFVSAFNVTSTSKTAVDGMITEFSKLSDMLNRVEVDYKSIVIKAGWEQGYDNIKAALESSITSAKTKVAELEATLLEVSKGTVAAIESLQKDATVTTDGGSSGSSGASGGNGRSVNMEY